VEDYKRAIARTKPKGCDTHGSDGEKWKRRARDKSVED
jgi:hypothetical protein